MMAEQTKTGKAYWRSLDDLAQTPEFREMMSKEFTDYSPDQVIASPTRRGFMKLMAASMALAGGVVGCRRWPETHVLPYTERPEGHVPGTPERFATVMEVGGVARPLLISSFDYRPTKAEGNPSHPLSRGATDVFAQASLLTMYDPARSRSVSLGGERSSWRAFESGLRSLRLKEKGGAGFAVLSDATDSPTVGTLRRTMTRSMPEARWFEYEPINRDNEVEGARLAFGRPLRPHLRLERAKVIATLDADVLGMHPASLKYAREWAKGRRPASEGEMNRLWAVDSHFTVTSSNADRRLPIQASRIPAFVRAVAAEVGVEAGRAGGVRGAESLSEGERAFAAELASDLRKNAQQSVVTVGLSQPPQVHALVWRINAELGNLGRTVTFTEGPAREDEPQLTQIARLVEAMRAGEVHTLLILGGNPVYNAPADLAFGEALAKVENTIHLSEYSDETSLVCDVHLPRSHYLECWRDARSWDGTVSIQQPLILPLYDTRSDVEVLAMALGDELREGYDLVRRTFFASIDSDVRDRPLEDLWRHTLHEGLLPGTGYAEVQPNLRAGGRPGSSQTQDRPEAMGGENALELVFTSDYSVYDGRFAENGWLQELPDPMTKLTWDNAAWVGPGTAKRLGVGQNDLIRIHVGERAMDAAVFIMPGQAVNSISIALGYGRSEAGYIGTGVGFDAYQVRTGEAMHVATAVEVEKLGEQYRLVSTQNHYAIDRVGMEERESRVFGNLVRRATLDEYREHPHFVDHMGPHTPSMKTEDGVVPLQLWQEPLDWDEGHQWGMAIDLSTCIGCSACVIACQAENNVPIVGKDQVDMGREMHWIRVDRYFSGDPEVPGDIEAVHQPLTCHHCETAPCESVCPVAATVHDAEGLNVMIYNRCIGTRYCSNNCPYKVRRFNWFDWHYKPVKGAPYTGTYLGVPDQQQNQINPIRQMQFNPEVTVRMRGVMEKCTFCIQRIKAATIPARNGFVQGERETDLVDDGDIVPACAQVCPTEAILFGNLNDPSSEVARAFQNPRAYEMLKELNVRARNRYLAQITNPGEGGEGGGGHGEPHEEPTAEHPAYREEHR